MLRYRDPVSFLLNGKEGVAVEEAKLRLMMLEFVVVVVLVV